VKIQAIKYGLIFSIVLIGLFSCKNNIVFIQPVTKVSFGKILNNKKTIAACFGWENWEGDSIQPKDFCKIWPYVFPITINNNSADTLIFYYCFNMDSTNSFLSSILKLNNYGNNY
jgi:hypothetical protein